MDVEMPSTKRRPFCLGLDVQINKPTKTRVHSTHIKHKDPQRTRDVIITSLSHQNDVATSFWRNNDVIITPCAHWVTFVSWRYIPIRSLRASQALCAERASLTLPHSWCQAGMAHIDVSSYTWRNNNVIITSKRRRDVVWRNYDVIIASCVHWEVHMEMGAPSTRWPSSYWDTTLVILGRNHYGIR